MNIALNVDGSGGVDLFRYRLLKLRLGFVKQRVFLAIIGMNVVKNAVIIIDVDTRSHRKSKDMRLILASFLIQGNFLEFHLFTRVDIGDDDHRVREIAVANDQRLICFGCLTAYLLILRNLDFLRRGSTAFEFHCSRDTSAVFYIAALVRPCATYWQRG